MFLMVSIRGSLAAKQKRHPKMPDDLDSNLLI